VLFHDSLAYWAQEWSLDVKLVLLADGEGGASAADLAAVESLAREYPDILLLYDKQYRIRYTALDALVPAGQVLALDTAVTGQGVADDWVNAMNKNLEQFRKMMEASV
jgi:ABC-type Zn uptake system ZnuABC Zn-binding protein ZnuA